MTFLLLKVLGLHYKVVLFTSLKTHWGLLRIFIQVELFPEKGQKFSWTIAVTAMRKVTKE